MHSINPVLQQALAPFAPPSLLTQYHQALQSFDWMFGFTDDHDVWARGSNALARLHRMQRKVDPDGSIWRSYPQSQQHGAPQPCSLQKDPT